MTDDRREWKEARDELVASITGLGFPEEFGNEIVKNLGSPKAMKRMNAYLYYVKPQKAELIADEMLAIRSDIDSWHKKKSGEEANARYNEMLNSGWAERPDAFDDRRPE